MSWKYLIILTLLFDAIRKCCLGWDQTFLPSDNVQSAASICIGFLYPIIFLFLMFLWWYVVHFTFELDTGVRPDISLPLVLFTKFSLVWHKTRSIRYPVRIKLTDNVLLLHNMRHCLLNCWIITSFLVIAHIVQVKSAIRVTLKTIILFLDIIFLLQVSLGNEKSFAE